MSKYDTTRERWSTGPISEAKLGEEAAEEERERRGGYFTLWSSEECAITKLQEQGVDLAMTQKKKCFNEHVDEERPPRHEGREKSWREL